MAAKDLHGIKISMYGESISHLLFADDCMLFARENLEECSKISEILRQYERATRQKINMHKSEICFGKNVYVVHREQITAFLNVKEVDRHSKYLGLPTMVGRSKKVIFSTLKERIWKKLNGYKEKLLSQAGREVLIKSVLQAIPIYVMSIFRIPDTLIDEIHSLLARFWWGGIEGERKLHWMS